MAQLSTGHVFMSYSRRDEETMRRIVTFLRNQGTKVWVDNEKLVPGTPIWEEEIEKAIKSAPAIVVVLSPDSKNSEWVRREISLADQYHKRIFPVLAQGDEDASITLRLVTRQYVDIRQNEETGLNSLSAALSLYLEEQLTQEREALEKADKLAHEKAEAERKAKEEAERLAAQKAEEERLEKAKLEAERLAEEKRRADEQVEVERKAREETESLATQKAEEERIAKAKLEDERLAKEKHPTDSKTKYPDNKYKIAKKTDIGRAPRKGEILLLNENAVKRFWFTSHLDCRIIVTNYRLIFWDQNNNKYSFELSPASLIGAKFKEEYTHDLTIELQSGVTYEIGLNYSGLREKVVSAIETIRNV